MLRNSLLVIGLSTLLSLPVAAVAAEPADVLRGFPRDQLYISAQARCVLIDTWVATTQAQRSQGLMYIESMEPHEGMLFLFQRSTKLSMWMKNTLISLDMLFIDAAGKIVSIAERTEPLSETIIQSGKEAAAVLELVGGAAAAFGIQPGHEIRFFAPDTD
jgi:uncharacterized membrane protein (UPF0127 family)